MQIKQQNKCDNRNIRKDVTTSVPSFCRRKNRQPYSRQTPDEGVHTSFCIAIFKIRKNLNMKKLKNKKNQSK